ncbi:MAG: bifunctional molybdenum cofactor biosynthesis protein MoaC/MoaB [Planctomycetes bacterium]|nr:bifunctional molybdenum cofactor biosynthesis protein MoaC/MoaB [Planctomycetota bacterium]
MFDVSGKPRSARVATARVSLAVQPDTIRCIREGRVPKGDPLEVAKVAAIQAAKNTAQIIPYCHPIPVDHVAVEYELAADRIEVTVTVKAIYKTGVEMEALTAASVCALTLYDMLKMLDESMAIRELRLVEKKGGKSDLTVDGRRPIRAVVVVMSDSVSAGRKADVSGPLIADRLRAEQVAVVELLVIPDDADVIERTLIRCTDERGVDLVVTTGGTGLGPRDHTPEAMARVLEREVPGIAEVVRAHGQERTPFSMLSRGKAGVRGRTLIVNLPGSPRGVAESLDAVLRPILHAFPMMDGGGHSASAADR